MAQAAIPVRLEHCTPTVTCGNLKAGAGSGEPPRDRAVTESGPGRVTAQINRHGGMSIR